MLNLELDRFQPLNDDEAIASLAVSSPGMTDVKNSNITDATYETALNYKSYTYMQNKWAVNDIHAQIRALSLKVMKTEIALNSLPSKERAHVVGYYVENQSNG